MKKIYALLAILVCVFVLAGCSSHTTVSAAPMAISTSYDMNGTWNQTSGMDGVTMTAVISDNKISITMQAGNESGIYWIGSLDGGSIWNTPYSGTIVSTADRSAMADDLYASRDATKNFTLSPSNGAIDLSYQFKMEGLTSTVHLSRSSE